MKVLGRCSHLVSALQLAELRILDGASHVYCDFLLVKVNLDDHGLDSLCDQEAVRHEGRT